MEKIYAEANQRATLRCGKRSIPCFTLQEAKIEWDKLPPEQKRIATIKMAGGPTYKAEQIERLHYGPKPLGA